MVHAKFIEGGFKAEAVWKNDGILGFDVTWAGESVAYVGLRDIDSVKFRTAVTEDREEYIYDFEALVKDTRSRRGREEFVAWWAAYNCLDRFNA